MLCAVLEKPRSLIVKEREIPRVGEGDILVRVSACAICGTDVKKYFLGHRLIKSYPIVPGHELSGEIVAVGRKAREFEVEIDGRRETRTFREGDRVVIAPVIACERCRNCLEGRSESCMFREDFGFSYDGGFEEYTVIPWSLLRKRINPVIRIPENVPFYMAAISEPFACALHAHKKLVRPGRWDMEEEEYEVIRGIMEGDVVVVIGGGPLGCMHAELAKISGADKVVIAQHSEMRLKMIKELGVADEYVLNRSTKDLVRAVKDLTDGRGADVVITATSSEVAQLQAVEIARQGGVVSFFGGVSSERVRIPTNKIHYNGPFVTGTSGASPHHIPIILRLMAEGKIDGTKYITYLLSLHMLERVLAVKGIPGFASLEEIVSSRGEGFLDFLEDSELGLGGFPTIREKAKAFKDSVLKALVVPSLREENRVISLSGVPLEERRRILHNLIN